MPDKSPHAAGMHPLRVALVITGLGVGGAEAMLDKLVQALPATVRVDVISLGSVGEFGERMRERGVSVHALGMRPGRPSLTGFLRLVRLLHRLDPQVVHTWMYHADLIGGLAARVAGIRAVMWGLRQSNLDPALNSRTTLRVVKLCARLSRHVPLRIASVAQRASDAHVAVGYAADRMVLIPNGFDLGRFRPDEQARRDVRAELGLAGDAPLIGMIGRFHPQKNHRGFCATMARIVAARPDVHALLAGLDVVPANGPLSQWLAEARIGTHCHLLGPRSDMPRLMAALDVLVLPSLGEAFPNVVGEAMACGVPCAVADVGDAAEIVGALGIVAPAGDDAALAAAVLRLLDATPEDRRRRALALPQEVRRRYDIVEVARQYERQYRSLAAAA